MQNNSPKTDIYIIVLFRTLVKCLLRFYEKTAPQELVLFGAVYSISIIYKKYNIDFIL